jgi:predicted cobalt transporter CbtA
MIWNLSAGWLFMAIVVVSMFSYILGYILDRIMERDGFGPGGNMVVIAAGFFAAIYLYNRLGNLVSNMREGVIVGLAGAFVVLATLSLGRALLNRA